MDAEPQPDPFGGAGGQCRRGRGQVGQGAASADAACELAESGEPQDRRDPTDRDWRAGGVLDLDPDLEVAADLNGATAASEVECREREDRLARLLMVLAVRSRRGQPPASEADRDTGRQGDQRDLDRRRSRLPPQPARPVTAELDDLGAGPIVHAFDHTDPGHLLVTGRSPLIG